MRKAILSIMVSLDGFIEGPNRDINWHVWALAIRGLEILQHREGN